MCGNAGRCACRYAFLKEWVGENLSLEADDGVHQAQVAGDRVRLEMRDPVVLNQETELRHGEETFRGISIDTGVPHVVLWVDDVDSVEVDSIGRAFRFARDFQPEGTNVNFVQILGRSRVKMRTYERGVEAETLACGTGAVAAGLAANLQRGALSPVEVQVPGGTLAVGFVAEEGVMKRVSLEGDARIVFEGTIEIEP
jgi:diaminopimelate epimerase